MAVFYYFNTKFFNTIFYGLFNNDIFNKYFTKLVIYLRILHLGLYNLELDSVPYSYRVRATERQLFHDAFSGHVIE